MNPRQHTKIRNPYDQRFFKIQSENSLESGRQIVPYLLELFSPKSVVDLGCGTGAWLSVFSKYRVKDLLGVDGTIAGTELLRIPASQLIQHDLSQKIHLRRQFDLALCLEVGEHLSAESAPGLVANLVDLSPVVIFSAAIPFQGGTNHINEQWPTYWAKLFIKHGYHIFDPIRPRFWSNPKVTYQYSQNILVYIKTSHLNHYPKLADFHITSLDGISLVHPVHYLSQVDPARSSLLRILHHLQTLPQALVNLKNRLK